MSYTKQNFTSGQVLTADNLNRIENHLASNSTYVTITEFGAKGDGVSDDTEALKSAIASGKPIYLPSGTYLLYEQIDLTQDLDMFGDGESSVIKLMPADQTRPEEYDGKTVYNCYMFSASQDIRVAVHLKDLVLDANKQAYIDDVLQNGSTRYDHTVCLDLQKPKNVKLFNVIVRNALIEGCYIWGGSSTKYVQIDNCIFDHNGNSKEDASGLHIEGAGKNVTLCNCQFYSNGFHGLLIASSSGKYTNISTHNNGYDGICLWGDASQNVISNVFSYGNRGGIHIKSEYSPHIVDKGKSSSDNNLFMNIVTEENQYGIMLGNSKNTRICGFTSINDQHNYALCSTVASSGNILNEQFAPTIDKGYDAIKSTEPTYGTSVCDMKVEFTKNLLDVYPLAA